MRIFPEDETEGLYDRLLEQIAQVMQKLEQTPEHANTPHEGELELQGLSPAEWELIQAYLRRDVQWLAGWQAAAHQQQAMAQQKFHKRRSLTGHEPMQPSSSCAQCTTGLLWLERPNVSCTQCTTEANGRPSKATRH